MPSSHPLSELRVLISDGNECYSFAKVDLLDDGNGLLLFDYVTKEKLSRHSNGRTFSRVAGAGARSIPTTTIPFSQIEHEIVRTVAIPSNATRELSPFRGSTAGAFVLPSSVLSSHATFAAEIVDDGNRDAVLQAWRQCPNNLSTHTWQRTGTGKTVIISAIWQPRGP